jgi:hypothetical protein
LIPLFLGFTHWRSELIGELIAEDSSILSALGCGTSADVTTMIGAEDSMKEAGPIARNVDAG